MFVIQRRWAVVVQSCEGELAVVLETSAELAAEVRRECLRSGFLAEVVRVQDDLWEPTDTLEGVPHGK